MTTQAEFAKRKKRHEFIGAGCLIQGVGLLFPIAGFLLGIPGVLIGIAICVALFFYGSSLSVKWICSACGNKLAGKHVLICPTCKAHLTD